MPYHNAADLTMQLLFTFKHAHAQLDKRTLLDNLALVLLTVDELCDGGKILEIDPSAIANRVLMRGASGGQPQMTELTIQQAIATAKEEFIRRMGT
jgi:coatomer subunit zeta